MNGLNVSFAKSAINENGTRGFVRHLATEADLSLLSYHTKTVHYVILTKGPLPSDTCTDLHIYILDAVSPVHVVWNNVDADKLTTANGGTFTSSSASLSNQSR